MRVVVTGGAGFIGSRVAAGFIARGANVLVVDDLSGGRADAVPAGADLIVADVADPATAAAVAAAHPGVVVHGAAQVSVSRSVDDPGRDRAVNVVGTANVIAGARRSAARLVFLSSGGAIYGETRGAAEDAPIAAKSPYGRHKREAEELVEQSRLPYAIARLANVYGPGQRGDLEGGVVAIFADQLARGAPLTIHGDGGQRRDFVHVDDAVRAILALADADRDGTWNVGSGRATSIGELVAAMEAAIAPAIAVRHGPPRAGDVRDSCLEIERIRADLGWLPKVSLEAGLRSLAGRALGVE